MQHVSKHWSSTWQGNHTITYTTVSTPPLARSNGADPVSIIFAHDEDEYEILSVVGGSSIFVRPKYCVFFVYLALDAD